jgi:hypothetical protein
MDEGAMLMKSALKSFFTIFLFCTGIYSQITFTANTERTTVAIGEQAVILVSLVADKTIGSIQPPAIESNESFAVINASLRGPSTSSFIEIINGVTKQRSEVQYQFIYTISPKKAGTFQFPSLAITIDGTEYTTKAIPFNATTEVVKNADVKFQLRLGKSSLYAGEQTTLEFRVCQRTQAQADVRNGFGSALEKIEKSFGKDFALHKLFTNQVAQSQERIDGEVYNIYALKFIVFALNSGSFTIPSIPFEYHELKRAQRRRSDPFDDFFDNDFFGGGVQATPRTALSNPLSITVKSLPPPPAGYSGSVGKFTLSASVEPQEVPAGEAATIRIIVKGNTKASSVGEITLPKIDNCEVFTPEKQTSSDTSQNGFTTVKTYKYMIIPQEKGTTSIPPVTLSYFDPESGNYKTESTAPLTLTVTEGKGTVKKVTRYMSQEEIRQIGQDIRFIKTGVTIKHQSDTPYRNAIFYLLLPLPFVIFILSLLYKFQASQRQKNLSLFTKQKALSTAMKQLTLIKKQQKELPQSAFLGKISQILENFISDKFDFPATGRTLEELKDELLHRNIDEKVVSEMTQFIQYLDSFRFGGLTFNESSRLSTVDKAAVFLESLERGIKKEKQK